MGPAAEPAPEISRHDELPDNERFAADAFLAAAALAPSDCSSEVQLMERKCAMIAMIDDWKTQKVVRAKATGRSR